MNPNSCVRLIDVLMLMIALAIGAALFAGALPNQVESRRVSVCAANLRGYGSSMYIYAQEGDVFPMATGLSGAGEMATFAYRNRQPDPKGVPSPTADLWMIIRENNATPKQLICPSSSDTPDLIKDWDAAYDVAGPNHLSYAYVYQYHPGRKPVGTGSNPGIPVMADANPYLKGGVRPDVAADRASGGLGNSRNHRPRKGQNILWADGHVNFVRTPWHGPSPGYSPYTELHAADNI